MPKRLSVTANINGTSGDDVLEGTKYTDFLEGFAGDDTISGAGGQDAFVFAPGHGDDVVTDFKSHPRGFDHSEKLTFGFGRFVGGSEQAGAQGEDIDGGEVFTTIYGHTLTVTDTGSDLLFDWSTGDSVLLVGVSFVDASALLSFGT
jgi:Ca2+-binding RTX toxin-like protein